MKKSMFILLISGVILSPLGVYAMNEEEAPGTTVSKAVPPDIQMLEKKAKQQREEELKKDPGAGLLPLGAFLSPEEQTRYYDYFNKQ